MVFDAFTVSQDQGIISYPDWSYAALPKQPAKIKETTIIKGSGTRAGASIGGSADSKQ